MIYSQTLSFLALHHCLLVCTFRTTMKPSTAIPNVFDEFFLPDMPNELEMKVDMAWADDETPIEINLLHIFCGIMSVPTAVFPAHCMPAVEQFINHNNDGAICIKIAYMNDIESLFFEPVTLIRNACGKTAFKVLWLQMCQDIIAENSLNCGQKRLKYIYETFAIIGSHPMLSNLLIKDIGMSGFWSEIISKAKGGLSDFGLFFFYIFLYQSYTFVYVFRVVVSVPISKVHRIKPTENE